MEVATAGRGRGGFGRVQGRVRSSRAWLRRNPMALDLALVLVFAAVAVGRVQFGHQDRAVAPVLLIAVMLPLVVRRHGPTRVYAATAAVAVAIIVLKVEQLAAVAAAAQLFALYTVAAYRTRATALACAAAFELWAMTTLSAWAPEAVNLGAFVGITGTCAAVVLTGVNLQTRRAYLAALEDRAKRLEHERDQQAQLAAVRERARIARDVHDIVAHSLSVMVALADGAAATATASPERATGAMRQVADTGRQAIGEMRRLLDTMRADDAAADADSDKARSDAVADLHPRPGIAQLDDLLDAVRAAGLPTRLTVEGRPQDLPDGVQLAVYRIVQESLTNTRKHAHAPTEAQVRLRYLERQVDVEITDDGMRRGPQTAAPPSSVSTASAGAGPVAAGAGYGIVGMRERAAVYAGTVDAGPAAHGGWRVHTRLHLDEAGGPR